MATSREDVFAKAMSAMELAKERGDTEAMQKFYLIAQQYEPVDFDVMTMIRNIPESTMGVMSDIGTMISHPIQTGSAIGKLGGSALEKGGRMFEEFYTGEDIAPEPGKEVYADQFLSGLEEDYGSVDAIKRKAMEDPAGMGLDIAGVLTPLKIPSKLLRAGAKGTQKLIPEGAPERLFESSTKFGTTLKPGERAGLTRTAIDERLIPGDRGIAKMNTRIETLGTTLDDLIAKATEADTLIPATEVLKHMNELRRTKGGVRMGKDRDLVVIDRMMREFDDLLGGRKTLTPAELQKFKRSAYEDINWNVRNLRGEPAEQVTLKSMARGAKEAVGEAVPGTRAANQVLSDLLDLKPHLERAAARIGNRNMFSIMAPLTGMATGGLFGGAIGGGAGTAIGVLGTMIMNPKMKARIAIAMDRFKKSDMEWIMKNKNLPEVAVLIAAMNEGDEQ